MTGPARVHAATAAVLAALVSVIVIFWQYPRLIVFLLLGAVAIAAYSALYLVLASRLDPLPRREPPEPAAELPEPRPARPARRRRATVEEK
jgi:hypothetical protein